MIRFPERIPDSLAERIRRIRAKVRSRLASADRVFSATVSRSLGRARVSLHTLRSRAACFGVSILHKQRMFARPTPSARPRAKARLRAAAPKARIDRGPTVPCCLAWSRRFRRRIAIVLKRFRTFAHSRIDPKACLRHGKETLYAAISVGRRRTIAFARSRARRLAAAAAAFARTDWKAFMRSLPARARSLPSLVAANRHRVLLGALVAAMLAVSGLAHGYGMFSYPYYENDEGIYMSQAWSLLTQGRLSPYAYWYDHAPAGWIALAGWAGMSGGFFTFGPSVNSGRVFMLIVHLASTGLLFYIARRLSGSVLAATFAALVFSLSPVAIHFQRRVLLDNMMVAWVLLSLSLLLARRLTRRLVAVSAVCFAVAVLTKETAVTFFPALFFLVRSRRADLAPLRFMALKWTGIAALVGALYPLYALSRGELFPTGFLGDTADRLSLIDTLVWQLSRGGGVPFYDPTGDFARVFASWLHHDPYLVIGGAVASVAVMLWSLSERRLRTLACMLLCSFAFVLRGGFVLDFYLIPLIPLVAMAIGEIAQALVAYIGDGRRIMTSATAVVLGALVFVPSILHSDDPYRKNETAPQVEALRFVKASLPHDARIAVDDYALADYRTEGAFGPAFPHADVYWKLESDPTVRAAYGNDWRSIDALVVTDPSRELLRGGALTFAREAYLSSRTVASFASDDTEYAFRAEVRRVDPDMPVLVAYADDSDIRDRLFRTFRTYKKFFFRTYGQIIDPSNGVTTSEGQSYAMLRAVWLDDREAFDGSWEWTRDHLQFRTRDSLFSWKWVFDKLEDSTNATDADEDIALALLFASKRWDDPTYLKEAKAIIDDLGEHAVVDIGGRLYFLPAHWESIEQWNGFLFNPSYLSPATYRIFAEVDPKHDWNRVADDSYAVLTAIADMPGNETGLPGDWVLVDKETGALSSARDYFDHDVDRFSYDAFRTLFRVALDYQWFGSSDAKRYLDLTRGTLTDAYRTHGFVPSAFAPSGEVLIDTPTPAIDAGYLASFLTMRDDTTARRFYAERFDAIYDEGGQYWGGDKYNYYDANWAWFATAMYNGDLKNLWQ